MSQFGEKVWFRNIGKYGLISFASRMTQGIFFVHHGRTGAVLCITKNGVVRQKLDKTDTKRCLGIDELGRFVWHSVADGGSRIEVDEESHSRQKKEGDSIAKDCD